MNQAVRQELLALVEEDQSFLGSPEHDWSSDRVQRQLLALLGRLRRRLVEILDTYRWPGKSLVGEDGAAAASGPWPCTPCPTPTSCGAA